MSQPEFDKSKRNLSEEANLYEEANMLSPGLEDLKVQLPEEQLALINPEGMLGGLNGLEVQLAPPGRKPPRGGKPSTGICPYCRRRLP